MDKSALDPDELLTELETANQLLADKDLELISVQKHCTELETKLQKVQVDFSQVRTKAQEMLVQKDSEIKRLREKTIGGRGNKEPHKNANNSGIDSDADDIIRQVYQSAEEQDSSSDEDLE